MGMRPGDVVVARAAAEAVRRGHPWVYRDAIVSRDAAESAGDEVRVRTRDGALLGRGLFDPDSPLAVRVFTADDTPVASVFAPRLVRAFALRQRLFADGRTSAYRLVHGEGDRLPGFVLDRYAHVAVLRTDGAAAAARHIDLLAALAPQLAPIGVRSLVRRDAERGKHAALTHLHGEAPPSSVEVEEHGVRFAVDLVRGQKTGAFLDQRDNRQRVGRLARGRRVLNLFSYAGGFSLHAAVGGAKEVTSVDIAAAAHATAQASFRLAGVDLGAHRFVTADVFAFLQTARTAGERWDLVVSDPPSFAPNERSVPRALSAYRSLHRACVGVLAPAGVLCASSCSSHVDAERFATTLDDASLGSNELRLLAWYAAPPDHPTLPAWPEGRYLKFAIIG